ncbi:MAG: glycosyltransferase [Acidimicrobiia bacterium]|nr:glycosyltransferase [Acidimicrobiia bacterium]
MAPRRLTILSLHTSPLAQPGTGDGGGMNVYVRALASALARAGITCEVVTRAERPDQQPMVTVEPGFRVVHVPVGPPEPLAKHELSDLVDEAAEATLASLLTSQGGCDALHANYWISGAVGHVLKHELDLPLVATFHTLARVKAEAGVDDDPEHRTRAEGEVIGCADLLLASTDGEREQLVDLYGADRGRIETVAPGVDHEVFHPGDEAAARAALGLAGRRVILFVGRIQPLKGADLAVRALAELDDRRAVLLVVGGPSGPDGRAELARLHALVHELRLEDRVRFVPPQPHRRLAVYYRAADLCVVPSRSESFGLVALEAAASGTPVVAADVGGLRSLVDDGVTGYLVEGRAPADYARPLGQLLDDAELAAAMGARAEARSRRYAWSITAGRLRRLYGDLLARALVQCR